MGTGKGIGAARRACAEQKNAPPKTRSAPGQRISHRSVFGITSCLLSGTATYTAAPSIDRSPGITREAHRTRATS